VDGNREDMHMPVHCSENEEIVTKGGPFIAAQRYSQRPEKWGSRRNVANSCLLDFYAVTARKRHPQQRVGPSRTSAQLVLNRR
jgi:hypothetical protein